MPITEVIIFAGDEVRHQGGSSLPSHACTSVQIYPLPTFVTFACDKSPTAMLRENWELMRKAQIAAVNAIGDS